MQQGRSVFMMLCSFQIPELHQQSHCIAIPLGVPPPEQCLDEEEHLSRTIDSSMKDDLEVALDVGLM